MCKHVEPPAPCFGGSADSIPGFVDVAANLNLDRWWAEIALAKYRFLGTDPTAGCKSGSSTFILVFHQGRLPSRWSVPPCWVKRAGPAVGRIAAFEPGDQPDSRARTVNG